MSLRMFHLVFISASVVLAAFVVAWAAGQYRVEHEPQYILLAIAAIVLGGALVVYGAAFQRKTRKLS